MPVSGLVVTLGEPGPDAERAVRWLNHDPRFTVGAADLRASRRLPVTVDTPHRQEDRACWDQLQAHPGVAFVDVACVFFEEAEPPPAATTGDDLSGRTPMTSTQGATRGTG